MLLRRRPAPLVAILLNAAFIGQTSVGIPTAFAASGLPVGTIVTFNITVVGTAILANSLLFAFRHKVGRGSGFSLTGSMAATAGATLLGAGVTPVLLAPLIGLSSVVFPLTLSAMPRDGGKAAGLARQLFVSGYIAGLAVFGGVSALGAGWETALLVAAATQLGSFVASLSISRFHAEAGAGGATEKVRPSPRALAPLAAVVVACGAIFFMRAGDSIRSNYFPLYLANEGYPPWMSAALLGLSAVVEIGLLPILASLAVRFGQGPSLIAVNAAGVSSFLIIASAEGASLLVLSQILYAVFGAGYQSLGIAWLQNLLPNTDTGGASIYTVAVQCGSVLGITTALAKPAFSSDLFFFGAAFAAVAAICVLIASRRASAIQAPQAS